MKPTQVVSLRLDLDYQEQLKAEATAQGMTLSGYLRRILDDRKSSKHISDTLTEVSKRLRAMSRRLRTVEQKLDAFGPDWDEAPGN